VVNPNLPDRGVKTDVTWLKASLPAADYAKVEEENVDNARQQTAYGIQARNLAKLTAAGVKIVVGTDGNTPYAPHIEMEDMVLAGMTPAQAIRAATSSAADLIGRAKDVGTVETGKFADIIAVNADPLADVRALEHVDFVMKGGVVYKDTRVTHPAADQ
jgi:imidazolonepropionase-like amidohydrolase